MTDARRLEELEERLRKAELAREEADRANEPQLAFGGQLMQLLSHETQY